MKEETIVTGSPEETRALARRLLADLQGRAVFALHGELGSGKTCFVQGLAEGLGIDRIITSPTFTLVNEYRAARPLYHLDLYRIGHESEALGFGLDDYLGADAVVAIEWAERAGDLLPTDTIHITFRCLPDPDQRAISIGRPSWQMQ